MSMVSEAHIVGCIQCIYLVGIERVNIIVVLKV